MKLKKDLVLRQIAGEYIVVPVGRLAQTAPMMRITDSTAWLWKEMEQEEFTEDSLAELVMGHFSGVTREVAERDIRNFMELLDRNYMLDNGRPEPLTGRATVTMPKEEAKRWKERPDT